MKKVTNDYYSKDVLRKTVVPGYQIYGTSECSIYLFKNSDTKLEEKCILEVFQKQPLKKFKKNMSKKLPLLSSFPKTDLEGSPQNCMSYSPNTEVKAAATLFQKLIYQFALNWKSVYTLSAGLTKTFFQIYRCRSVFMNGSRYDTETSSLICSAN